MCLTIRSPSDNMMQRYVRELSRRRDLLLHLVMSGLKAQHRNSVLGYFWWLLDPLVGVLLYYFVVVIVFDRQGGATYGLYLVIGMIVWRWVSSTIQGASKSVVSQAGIIQQVYLPKAIFPIGVAMTQLFNFGFGLLIIAGFSLAFGVIPGKHLVWLPLVVATQLSLMLAIALPIAFYCVFVRDIESIVAHGIRVWFFASPVIWTPDRVADVLPGLLLWNPMAHLLGAYRDVLLFHRAPDFAALGLVLVASSSVIVWMTSVYSRSEYRIVKAL